MIYFTSDLHLNHDKEFIYKDRGFNTIDEMNSTIIRNWNNLVEDSDIVYILGDIMLGTDESIELFNKLKGQKKIVLGNHDTTHRAKLYSQAPNTEVLGYASLIKIKKQLFYLSHYPTIMRDDPAHFRLKHSAICLFGHIHSTEKFYKEYPYIYHVGLDAHNFTPVALPDILEDIRVGMQKIK